MNAPSPEAIVAASGVSMHTALGRLAAAERDWGGDPGLGPRMRLEDVPGPTALERRVFGLPQDAAAPELLTRRGRPAKPTDSGAAAELAERCGIRLNTAYWRLTRYRQGKITAEQLNAPLCRHKSHPRQTEE